PPTGAPAAPPAGVAVPAPPPAVPAPATSPSPAGGSGGAGAGGAAGGGAREPPPPPAPAGGAAAAGSAGPPGSAPAAAHAEDPYMPDPEAGPARDAVGTRLIDVATPFTVGSRHLELLVTHRFNQAINQGGSAHNLWGLDSGADFGIGFTYGLLRNLDLSVYRSAFQEDYEL